MPPFGLGKRRGFLLSAVLATVAFAAFGFQREASATVTWAKTYGGAGDDRIGFVHQTSDGGYILVGRTTSFGAGDYDIWILKLDAFGDIQWQKAYGGPSNDRPYFMDKTLDGGYVVAGYTSSFGAGGYDVWILKFDALGNIQWQKTYGGSGEDWEPADDAISIQQTSDSGYIVSASTQSFGAGGRDVWILKLDSEGDPVWQKTYGGPKTDFAHSIRQTSDGGYIVACTTHSFGAGYADIWILKLDNIGNVEWQRTFGGPDYERGTFIQQTSDNGYIVTGFTYSFDIGVNGDIWVLKLDTSGNLIWQKTYGGTNLDGSDCIHQTSDGGYIVSGNTSSFGQGDSDTLVLKLDEVGNVQWQKTYGGAGYDTNHLVQQTLDGGYVLAGNTTFFGAGNHDVWILKVDRNGNISNCFIVADSNAMVRDSNAQAVSVTVNGFDTNVAPEESLATVSETDATAMDVCSVDGWVLPLNGEWFNRYQREFGVWVSSSKWKGYHLGVDVWRDHEAEVYAAHKGKVAYRSCTKNMACVVVIDHTLSDGDYCSVYWHLRPEGLIEKGANVTAGELIGYLADVKKYPKIEKTHLHFEIIEGLFDPKQRRRFIKGYGTRKDVDLRYAPYHLITSNDLLIDEYTPFFEKGLTKGWRRISNGYSSGAWATTTTKGDAYWGKWNLGNIRNYNKGRLGAGKYEVWVYILGGYKKTNNAKYEIRHNGKQSYLIIDQSLYSNEWVNLGTFDFAASGEQFVRLDSDTGEEPALGRNIIYDAIKLTYKGP